jgi:hypothetical protein
MSYRYKYDDSFEDDFFFIDCHLVHWISERCIHREGYDDWGGLKVLERDFYDWCVKSKTPVGAASAVLFEQGLQIRGHRIEDGMVSGLFLKEDLWALEAH